MVLASGYATVGSFGSSNRLDYTAVGGPAYEAESMIKVAHAHVNQPPPDLQQLRPDLPPRLTAVILRCLAKDPVQRFASASEISTVLLGVNVAVPQDL
jgi:serine/threonine protein kinase